MRRVCIVTGAGSGIGRAVAAALLDRGEVVVLADVDTDAVEATTQELGGARAGPATSATLDVRDAGAFAELVRATVAGHGRLDLLVNNAGIGIGGPVENLATAHWDRIIDVNLRGVVHGVQAVYPLMVEQGFGQIANVASLAGLVPAPLLTPYAATKHAVVGLSLSLRLEAAEHGVRVSAICPGPVDTPILDKGAPADLPPVPLPLSGRALLERTAGRPYPPERLAQDILVGLDRDAPLIVAPASARVAWWAQRLTPALVARAGLRTVRWARQQTEAAEQLVRG